MEAIPGTLTLAAGGFRDMTRIASAPYDMYDILFTNKTAVQNILIYIDTLQQIKESLIDDSLQIVLNKPEQYVPGFLTVKVS